MEKRINQIDPKVLERYNRLHDECMGWTETDEEIAEHYKTNADLAKEARDYMLDSFYEGGHMNCELQYECPKEYRSLVGKLKRFINRYGKEEQ